MDIAVAVLIYYIIGYICSVLAFYVIEDRTAPDHFFTAAVFAIFGPFVVISLIYEIISKLKRKNKY